jgi:hypothetical protein
MLMLALAGPVCAQEAASHDAPAKEDTRTQYPAFLANSYFGVSGGYVQYDFSQRQLEPGFHVQAVEIPHASVRVVLVGHQFNRFLSAQLTYMRPVVYVSYRNINGDEAGHHLFAHFGGITLMPELPLTPRLSLAAEVGLGLTSRRGIAIDNVPVVKEAHYPSMLLGGGVRYHLSSTWDVTAGTVYLPAHARDRQPHTLYTSAGFQYNLRPLPPERVEANRQGSAIFPKHVLQTEYTTGVGYGINDLVSTKVPIFWRGNVEVARGIAVHYQRNVFHTRTRFALDFGGSVSSWLSRHGRERFATVSVYPLLRFTLVRTQPADFYVCYSLAGPTYVSKIVIDQLDTGRHFTFQDFMGVGAFIGKGRRFSAGLKINHYSNGNIFTRNAGIKVPLTVDFGYTF